MDRFRICPFYSMTKGKIVSTLNQYKWSFCNGKDDTSFCNNTRKKHDGTNGVTACYQHVSTCKLVSDIRTMWFSWMSSFLGSVCRSKFSRSNKSMFLLSHWTLFFCKIPVYPQISLSQLIYLQIVISHRLKKFTGKHHTRKKQRICGCRDMGSHPHQKDCKGTLKVFVSSHHRFMNMKSCLNNPRDFQNEMTGLGEEGRAVDFVYLEFGKAFNISSYNISLTHSEGEPAEQLGSESCDQHLEAQLGSSHWQCVPRVSAGSKHA